MSVARWLVFSVFLALPATAWAQDERLTERLDPATASQVQQVVDSARRGGLPGDQVGEHGDGDHQRLIRPQRLEPPERAWLQPRSQRARGRGQLRVARLSTQRFAGTAELAVEGTHCGHDAIVAGP